MTTTAQWVEGARPRTLPAALSPVLVGTGAAAAIDGARLDRAALALVVARGYRLRPDLPGFDGDTFTTGDVGYLDPGGRLVVVGRADDLVVTGGEKVAPAAVEAALAEHPSVVEVAVVGVPDEEWGQRVVAAVVLRAPLSLGEAREHVAVRVARVAAPRELRVLDALPMLPTGKLDRNALRSSS